MRIIVMFDLPTQTVKDMRTYRNFRKFLIKNGFFMMHNRKHKKKQTSFRYCAGFENNRKAV